MNRTSQHLTEQLRNQFDASTFSLSQFNQDYIVRDCTPKDWCHCVVDGDYCGEGCMNSQEGEQS